MPGTALGRPNFEPLAALGGGPQHPSGSLLLHRDGNFYGTTYTGGGFGNGTLYKVTPSGALNVVVHFPGVSGSTTGTQPVGGLISDAAGILWGVTAGGGANDLGTIFKADPQTRELTTLLSFTGISGIAPGHAPAGGLVSDGAGNYWGTTFTGGANDLGTVFKFQTNTRTLTSVASFTGLTGTTKGSNPAAGLVSDGNGFLWGTTRSGGSGPGEGNGTVFKVNIVTNVLSTVASFTGTTGAARGAAPDGELVSDGAGFLWGTTAMGGSVAAGSVFKIHATTHTLTTVVDLQTSPSPQSPNAALVSDGAGFFWGTTVAGGGSPGFGTIFKVNAVTGVRTTVVRFAGTDSPKGRYPQTALVRDGAGYLWGTTFSSAPYTEGTIFKVHTGSGLLTTVAELSDSAGGAVGTGIWSGLASDGNGALWGTAQRKGRDDFGTVFKFDVMTRKVSTPVEFSGGQGSAIGAVPHGMLFNDGTGYLWGTTTLGGPNGLGTVFKIAGSTGSLTPVVLFNNPNPPRGAVPESGLVRDTAGSLWGTTSGGGAPGNRGTIFKLDPATGALTTIVTFTGTTGAARGSVPLGELATDGPDLIRGTTARGGANDLGTIFKLHTGTGVFTTVAEFTGSSGSVRGSEPRARLVSDGAGFFWGTTSRGGNANRGTVFKIEASTGNLTTLAEFTGTGGATRGSEPWAGLTRDGGGAFVFWGTTNKGGPGDLGTLFRISGSGQLSTVFDFTGTSGAVPGANPGAGALLAYSDGSLYGTTFAGGVSSSGDPAGGGQIFRVNLPDITVHDGATVSAPVLSDDQQVPVDFGRNVQGTPSTRSFAVSNTSAAELLISSFSVSPGYTALNMPALPLTIARGQSITFQISLSTLAVGVHMGTVTIASDDLDEQLFDFPLTGEVFIPTPLVSVVSMITTLNRQTGLREQVIHITNDTTATVPAYYVIIRGLPGGVEINNASETRADGSVLIYIRTGLQAHSNQDIVLEYYSANRAPVEIHPQISTEVILTLPDLTAPPGGAGLTIDKVTRAPGGEMMIEFTSVPGQHYEVQYSGDSLVWQSSLPQIRASANRIQWIDRGLPRTDSHPAQAGKRFYRVRKVNP